MPVFTYWRRQVAGGPALLELPADQPWPSAAFCEGRHTQELDRELSKSLKKLSQREGTSLETLLLAVFQTLLYRYTNQEEFLVAATAPQDPCDTLPCEALLLHADLSGAPVFREVLSRTERTLREALADGNNRAERIDSDADLALSVEHRADGLVLTLLFDANRFHADTADRMLGHYRTLLDAVAADPGRAVSALPLLTEREWQVCVQEWNNTAADVPLDRCVHELIEAWSDKSPDAVAIVGADGATLTYRELNQQANQLARYLRKLGVGPGEAVGVCLERSPAMIVAFLAALRAGGAYLPMDLSYPPERLAYMAEDAQVRVLITREGLVSGILPAVHTQVLCLDRNREAIGAEPAEPLLRAAGPGDLAYIIYTSGSTGKPKGAEIPHDALLNLVFWHLRTFQPTPADRATHVAGVSFDASVLEIWPTLVAGASLYLPTDELRLSPADFRDWLLANRMTLAFLPTPLAELFLGLDGLEALPLRYLFTGGDRLTRYPPAGAPFALVNCYGPTENTVVTTVAVFGAAAPEGARAPSIGRPIANNRVYLLDSHLQPVPAGVPGELYAGGLGLARGYRNRPELTAERFIANPFSPEKGARLYRTGDLARYLPDGTLEYLGRIDDQVKIRGFRVELGEIETVLGQLTQVREAVVVAHTDAAGEKRLVAYVVLHAAGTTALELHQALKQTLPEYMVPSLFVMLEALPLTANGKVDRRALPAPDLSRPVLAGEYTAPRTPLETDLANICRDVLGVDRLGVYDNFFEMGGHSLLAMKALSRIREHCQVPLPVRSLFQAPTVAALAELVAAARAEAAGLPAIPPASRGEYAPLSFAQQRMWFQVQLQPDLPMFNIPLTIRLRGSVDIPALEQSLEEMTRRHESLRTVFPVVEGRPVQAVLPAVRIPVPLVDLREIPAADRQAACDAWIRAESVKLFRLDQAPLLRAAILQVEHDEFLLHLTVHHMVFDGWSGGVFLPELCRLYGMFAAGRPNALPEPAIQYIDYALWERDRLQGEALQALLTYWRQQLDGAPVVLELPCDHPRPAVQTNRGARQARVFSPELTHAVKALGQREGATLFMTLLAAFQTLLYRYSGQRDFLVGTAIANRTQVQTEGLIGFFANTLPLRADLSGAPSFRKLLARTRHVTLEAFAHQELPFERMVEALQPVRNPSYSPLVQVVFVLQNAPMGALDLPGVEVTAVESDRVDLGTARFDLTLITEEQDGGLYVAIEYNTDLFESGTIERMLGHYQTLLESIVAEAGQPVGLLPLMPSAERHRMLVDWNETAAVPVRTGCVHEWVRVQADCFPDAPACVGADHSALTYRQLVQKANQLAQQLQRLGVGPETVVAVCAERSPAMLVALVGVLIAGGAYLPMDPAYPPDRLAYMVADSNAPVLLTQESLLDKLSGVQARLICLDRDWPLIEQEPAHAPATAVAPANLAYVIYTSGSTGKPKGVAIPHAGLMNLVNWYVQAFQLTAADRSTHLAGVGFDASVFEIWPCLAAGAALYLADEEVRLSPAKLRDWLMANAITVAFLPTPLAESFLTVPGIEHLPLRYLHTGGDRLTRYPPAAVPFTFVNNYGPTESTVCTTSGVVGPCVTDAAPSIGRPIANTRVYLLDANLQPVPIGVPGELYTGGASLARGYLNRPDLTRERFISNPLEPGGGVLYRTGDLARYLPDGSIEYLGRLDDQVKIRGFRIELGEIEAVLSQTPGVREAVVVARDDGQNQKRLVAYVVPDAGEHTAGSLQGALQAKLPAYMIPSAFVVLPALPLTPNGKVDRRALPAPDLAGCHENDSEAAPRTEVEEWLARTWAELLKLPRVGRADNFFALGGHSLLMTEVVSRIREGLGLELPLKTVFEAPTIAQLAEAIDGCRQTAAARSQIPGLVRDQERRVEQLLSNLDQLSDEELDALLNSTAEEAGGGD